MKRKEIKNNIKKKPKTKEQKKKQSHTVNQQLHTNEMVYGKVNEFRTKYILFYWCASKMVWISVCFLFFLFCSEKETKSKQIDKHLVLFSRSLSFQNRNRIKRSCCLN